MPVAADTGWQNIGIPIGPVHLMKSDGALDEPAPCPPHLRKRLPKHKSCGVQKQEGYGDTDDDIWPERLEPGY